MGDAHTRLKRTPSGSQNHMATQTFPFRFTTPYRLAGLPFGVTPATATVRVGGGELAVRFGPWRVRTTLANVTSTALTGPFSFLKTAGPAHLSLADRGLTMAPTMRAASVSPSANRSPASSRPASCATRPSPSQSPTAKDSQQS